MSAERGNARLRALDRWAGVPLVAGLALLTRVRRRARPAQVRRVGLLKTAAIGDTVLMSAIVRDLTQSGDVEVVVFTGAQNADAARLIEGIAQVVVLPVTNPLLAAMRLRRTPVDLLVDFGSWPRIDAVLAAVAGAGWTAGFRTAGQRRHLAFDQVVDHSEAIHELENYRRLVAAVGFSTGAAPSLGAGDPVPSALVPGRPYVTCHMWSGGFRGMHKEWRRDRWAEVVRHLVGRGYHVALTGGTETSRATAEFRESVSDLPGRVHDLTGRLSLSQTLGLLRGSALVISVNTGIMHMAAAAGVPVISLEGPVPVQRWGPIGPRARSVVSLHPQAGYLNLGWEYGEDPPDTMGAITSGMVVAAADEMLAEGNPR